MRNNSPRDGFILYAVLGVVALLSSVFVSVSLAARNSAETAAVAGLDLEDEALLQAGLQMAGYQLLVAKLPGAQVDGQEIRLDGGVIRLTVTSEAGKADLNGSDAGTLEAAYRAAGSTALTPAAFAGRVIDWRDPDDEPQPDGAETADYADAVNPAVAANRPFATVEELRWVLGVSASDIEALRPFVTVFNPAGQLAVASVDPLLAGALPGMDETRLAVITAARDMAGPEALSALRVQLAEAARFFSFEPPTTFRVAIAAQTTGGIRTARAEAVIIPPVNDAVPFQIVDWRR